MSAKHFIRAAREAGKIDESIRPARGGGGDIITFLTSLASRLNREQSRDVARLGLSLQGARLLSLLLERDSWRCAGLSDALDLDAPTLSHLLRALVDRDLVSRERARDDNRSVVVKLSAEGQRLAEICRDIEAERRRVLFEGVDDAEIARVTDMLGRIDTRLQFTRDKLAPASVES